MMHLQTEIQGVDFINVQWSLIIFRPIHLKRLASTRTGPAASAPATLSGCEVRGRHRPHCLAVRSGVMLPTGLQLILPVLCLRLRGEVWMKEDVG
jgi:hypothetical protein